MTRALRLAALLALAAACPARAQTPADASRAVTSAADTSAVVRYADAPLRAVIADVEARTAYRFLYRDALVAGRTVTCAAPPARLPQALAEALRAQGLAVTLDAARQQILLAAAPKAPGAAPATGAAPRVLTGTVVDDATGARLPAATLTWRDPAGRVRGTAANEAGAFRLAFDAATRRAAARADTLVAVRVAYLGYRTARLAVDPAAPGGPVDVRLVPAPAQGPTVVVQGLAHAAALDTTWRAFVRPRQATPFGEASVVRALDALPAVGLTPSLTSGLSVRGSRTDGFRVLLDGMPIYSPSHLFGAFDAFVAEALQRVGFHYDVPPARLAAPPGGTLAFATRTGAQTTRRGMAGASQTAVRAAAEGPLAGGRASWLVAGRYAYLDAIDWLGNDRLVAQGLGAEPAATGTVTPTLSERLRLGADAPTARFYDVHGKLYVEGDGGRRWTLSAYAGGDSTAQVVRRVERLTDAPDVPPRDRFGARTTTTANAWGNLAASVQLDQPLGARAFGHLRLAASRYHAAFTDDDFVFLRPRDANGPRLAAAAFRYDNALATLVAAPRLMLDHGPGTWSVGAYAAFHRIDYDETAGARRDFAATYRSLRADAFAEWTGAPVPFAEARVGLRVPYFGLPRALRLSPRVRLRLFPERPVSLGVGYHRGHQFLHRLSIQNATSADVWIASTPEEPPGTVDQLSAGVYLRPGASVAVQVEGYWKHHRRLRLHEAQLRVPDAGVFLSPWVADNEARARGMEALAQWRGPALEATLGYTLSRVDVQNDRLNAGAAFPADWDRRHQLTAQLRWAPTAWLAAYATWRGASGAPNDLADAFPDEPDRLRPYHRLDLGVQATRAVRGVEIEAGVSVFNAYDRANPWYRTAVLTADGPPRNPTFGFTGADVADLGLHPAANLAVRF